MLLKLKTVLKLYGFNKFNRCKDYVVYSHGMFTGHQKIRYQKMDKYTSNWYAYNVLNT